MYNSVFYANEEYERIETNDGLICINYAKGNWIKLNASSSEFYKRINEVSLQSVLSDFAQELAVPVEVVSHFFEPVITQLITSKLILCRDPDVRLNMESTESEDIIKLNQIWIHVTDTCNLTCSYCYYRAKKSNDKIQPKYVNVDQLISFLGQIDNIQQVSVIISGGEPFLTPDLPRLVKQLKEDLHIEDITVITNGTMHHELYKDVLPYIDTLQISIDGTNSALHDVTRGTGNFEKTMIAINVATSLGFKGIKISYSIHDDNLTDIKNLPALAYSKGISNLHLNRLLKVGRNCAGCNSGVTSKEFDAYYAEFLKALYEFNTKINYEREVLQVGVQDRRSFIEHSNSFSLYSKVAIAGKLISCGLGVGMISVDTDGTIYPCPSLHHDYLALGSIADPWVNIKDRGIKTSQQFSVDNEQMACHTCKSKYFCGGGCRAEALANGDIYGDYLECANFQDELIETLKVF